MKSHFNGGVLTPDLTGFPDLGPSLGLPQSTFDEFFDGSLQPPTS